ECPYWGCVPSKTLLRSGETLEEAGRARRLAASRVDWEVDFPKVSKRVLWMARDLDDKNPAAALQATGAKLFRGAGTLIDLRTVVEAGPRFLGLEEPEAGAALLPHLKEDGLEIIVGDACVAVETQASDIVLHLKSGAVVSGDRLLVATGRRPNYEAWKPAGLAQ